MISKQLRFIFCGLLLACVSTREGVAATVEPSPAALARLTKLRVRRMGIDRAGNLWVLGAGLGMVTLISPSGIDLGITKATGALAVDADAEWGVVGIFSTGYEIQWLKEDGEPRTVIRLAGPAADLCWIGPELVAVSLETADHRIEIWNLRQKARIQTLGEETPLHPGLGATRMRAILLRYDFERSLLYSLESFTGDLQVFNREGRLVWRGAVDSPRRADGEKWLLDVDEKAKAERDSQAPTIFLLHLALSPQGDAWVLQSVNKADHTITFVRIGQSGNIMKTLPEGACPSYHFLIWGSHVVSFRDPASPEGACVGVVPFP